MSAYNFGVRGRSPTKLCHLTRLGVGVLTHVQLLGATPPLKFGKTTNVQNLVRFTTTFEFGPQISLKPMQDSDKI